MLPVWITQSTGAETKGAEPPLESLSASPFEMFSILMVNVLAGVELWADATRAETIAEATRTAVRANVIVVSSGQEVGESGAVAKFTANRLHQIVTARYLPRSRSDGTS